MAHFISSLGHPVENAGWRVERRVRVIAGAMVLASLALSLLSPLWLLLTAFVGVNLMQSGLTGWCLMNNLLSLGSNRK